MQEFARLHENRASPMLISDEHLDPCLGRANHYPEALLKMVDR